MIIDTSGLIAILRDEPEAATFAALIEAADNRRLSAAGYVEIAAVIDRANDRAQLNFGDCFAYALAKSTGERLLFKGLDFIHTDVEPAAA